MNKNETASTDLLKSKRDICNFIEIAKNADERLSKLFNKFKEIIGIKKKDISQKPQKAYERM